MADILNIFSKKSPLRRASESDSTSPFHRASQVKKEAENNITQNIIVDKMERNAIVAGELINLGCKVEFRKLDIGDYIIGDIIIERKSASDFFSSMVNKRLIRQVEEIKQFDRHLLIVEGFNNEFYKKLENSNALRGFLLHLLLEEKVPIAYTLDEKDTALFLSLIAKKNKKTELSFRGSRRILNDKERAQFILEGFYGIGPKTAKKLLEKFGSLKNVFSASEEQVRELIGKKSDEFLRILRFNTTP